MAVAVALAVADIMAVAMTVAAAVAVRSCSYGWHSICAATLWRLLSSIIRVTV